MRSVSTTLDSHLTEQFEVFDTYHTYLATYLSLDVSSACECEPSKSSCRGLVEISGAPSPSQLQLSFNFMRTAVTE